MTPTLPRWAWILIAVVAGLAWFSVLDHRKLQHPDEGRYSEIAREMAVSGDWVTPRLNDLKYFEKPPLQYWLTAAVFRTFGTDEWTARLVPALAGFLGVLVVGFTAGRLAGATAGVYAGLGLLGCVWHIGLSHFVTLDALLTFWLTVALCAFLLAQQATAPPAIVRRWMLVMYAALALATLTKGLVALVLPGASLVLYTIIVRDLGPWRRLHLVPGLAVYLVITAPWFILVSRANPEFAQFFFIHEHFQRFLSTEHRRTGAWWYFVPLFVGGLMPWPLAWAATVVPSWRRSAAAANGFRWERFCLVHAAFVFVFFSLSGSKLPSYILPMFPALMLVFGVGLTRISARLLGWMTLFGAVAASLLLLVLVAGWPQWAARFATAATPVELFLDFGPWIQTAVGIFAAGALAAAVAFRRDTPRAKSVGILLLSLSSLAGFQVAFAGHDAFRPTRSAFDILRAAEAAEGGALAPGVPVYQLHGYDQTLSFYLARPTTLVAFVDEFGLGLRAEPDKGIADEAEWIRRWDTLPQGYALMPKSNYAELAARGLPMRVLAADPRRVFVARR
jgi:4-amino-4-deoxy-L-arabinose transferase-like glycosyltransferase